MVDDQIEKHEAAQSRDITETSHYVGRWLRQELQTPLDEITKILDSRSLDAETDTQLKGFIGQIKPTIDKTDDLVSKFENSKEVLVKHKGSSDRFEVEFSKENIPVSLNPGKILIAGEDAAKFIDAFADSIGNVLVPLQWVSVVAAKTKHDQVRNSTNKIEKLANQMNEVIDKVRTASTFEIQTNEEGKVTITTYKKPLESL